MPKRKLPSNETVIKEYREGYSTGEIAEKYNVVPSAVVSCLRRAGEPRRNNTEAQALAIKNKRNKPPFYWKGKRQPKELVEKRSAKIRGKNHYLWKGGKSRRNYRNVIKKVNCESCGIRNNLGIHHKNFDHYDNKADNLQVLCVSCHISLHKKEYWKAVKSGKTPKRSNGPIGWEYEKH